MTRHIMIGGIIIAILACAIIDRPESHEITVQVPQIVEQISIKEALYTEFFEQEGSPCPAQVARAVIGARRPRLLAAVAAVESCGDPTAVGGSGERGAWQVIEKDWGRVGYTLDEQAIQAEDILESLIEAHSGQLENALREYNGGPEWYLKPVTKDYARKVLAKVRELPK